MLIVGWRHADPCEDVGAHLGAITLIMGILFAARSTLTLSEPGIERIVNSVYDGR